MQGVEMGARACLRSAPNTRSGARSPRSSRMSQGEQRNRCASPWSGRARPWAGRTRSYSVTVWGKVNSPPPSTGGPRSPRAAPAGHRRPGRGHHAHPLEVSNSPRAERSHRAAGALRARAAHARDDGGHGQIASASRSAEPPGRAAPWPTAPFSTPTERGRRNSHPPSAGRGLDCGGRCAIEEAIIPLHLLRTEHQFALALEPAGSRTARASAVARAGSRCR